jgi:hypothetical protein
MFKYFIPENPIVKSEKPFPDSTYNKTFFLTAIYDLKREFS